MSSLQSRREFLGSTATTAAGLSLPSLPYLAKTDLVKNILPNPNEDIGLRFLRFDPIATKLEKTYKPFSGSSTVNEHSKYKLLADLMFNPYTTEDEVKSKFRKLYQMLSNPLQAKDPKRVLDEIEQSYMERYRDRLIDITEMSLQFNHLIPYETLSYKEKVSFNKTLANYMQALATREDTTNYRYCELMQAFFELNSREMLSKKADLRLSIRREMAEQLSTPTI